MSKITPRDYQVNARDQAISKIDEGMKRLLVYLPTGMGKTLIVVMILDYLLENEYLGREDKVLFLVNDRKLKHQLHDMALQYGLGKHGNLFVLPEGTDYPPHLVRQHAAMARFLFTTPVLFLNSLYSRSRATQKLDRSFLKQVKVVVIDEVLDVLAQSYGKKRTKEETVEYIKEVLNIDDYAGFIEEMAARYEVSPRQLENVILREFSPKYYRINKKFEPVLSLLGLLDPKSDILMLGLTASFSQEMKRKFLVDTLGGNEFVAEIFPEGEDFEDYRPSIKLRKIRVIDDFISRIDGLIQEIKNSALTTIKKAYNDLTGSKHLPSDRVMLFITDLLSRKEVKERLRARMSQRGMDAASIEDTMRRYMSIASAYLLITVGRQKLLENTLTSFYRFVKTTKNKFLLSNEAFSEIKNMMEEKMQSMEGKDLVISEKDKKLLYWIKRFVSEGKKVLLMCRFVNMVNHVHAILNDPDPDLGAGLVKAVAVHGRMDGVTQNMYIRKFKEDPAINVLVASERLIEKGTDLPETDVGVYYGSTISLERYEQSLGRIRSNVTNLKSAYTIAYNLTVEAEKSAKRDAAFLDLLQRSSKRSLVIAGTGDLNDDE